VFQCLTLFTVHHWNHHCTLYSGFQPHSIRWLVREGAKRFFLGTASAEYRWMICCLPITACSVSLGCFLLHQMFNMSYSKPSNEHWCRRNFSEASPHWWHDQRFFHKSVVTAEVLAFQSDDNVWVMKLNDNKTIWPPPHDQHPSTIVPTTGASTGMIVVRSPNWYDTYWFTNTDKEQMLIQHLITTVNTCLQLMNETFVQWNSVFELPVPLVTEALPWCSIGWKWLNTIFFQHSTTNPQRPRSQMW